MNKDDAKEKLAKRIFLNDLNECERFPKYLMIETINACNARCIMCGVYNHDSYTPPEKLSQALFDKALEELKLHSDWIEMVSVYGRGEPLLDSGISYKIKKLRDIGIKQIQLSTNVALLTEDKTREILGAGLNDLRFSIDSVKKETYEKIRVGLKFDDVMSNALKAIKIRNDEYPNAPIRVRAVAMDINKDERNEWLSFWDSHLNKNIDTAQFIPYRDGWSKGEEGISRKFPCISPFSSMCIRSNGSVALCCEKWNVNYSIGDINSQSITEIWQGEILKNMRKLHLNFEWSKHNFCKNCVLWE